MVRYGILYTHAYFIGETCDEPFCALNAREVNTHHINRRSVAAALVCSDLVIRTSEIFFLGIKINIFLELVKQDWSATTGELDAGR
jgi:hypothetical protein